jgi:hypothetical protein
VRKQNSGFEQSRPEYIRVFLPSSQNIVVWQKVQAIADTKEVVKLVNELSTSQR